MEPLKPAESSETREPRPLPPEVEAELCRRAASAPPPPRGPLVDPAAPRVTEASRPGWLQRLGPLGVLLLFLVGKLKSVLLLLQFALPVLKTGGTMLLSMVLYSQLYGWPFAAGFVVGILAHEMGHVFMAWRLGIPVTAPIFIPGFGALILQKARAKSAWEEALIGIGGPVAGLLAGLVYLFLHRSTGNPLWLALAYTTFFLNLFNLAPVFPLDGGWITGAVSPRLWLFGLVGMVALFATGFLRNPLILLLLLFSLPRLWQGLKTGDVTPRGGVPTTAGQRLQMGLAYLFLCGLLAWLMASAHS